MQRVAVDVVVKDSAGNPVTGLTQNDFRVIEDSKPQTVRSFDAYSADMSVAQAKASLKVPELPPQTFSNFSAVTQSGPLTVVLLDLLNTPLNAQADARNQLFAFLHKRSRTAPVAVFAITDGLHLLQGFTDDDKALKAALSRQSDYKSTELLTAVPPSTTGDSDAAGQAATQPQASGVRQAGSPGERTSFDQADPEQEIEELLQLARTEQASAFLDRRVEITVGALKDIAEFLSALPGRKNLIETQVRGQFSAFNKQAAEQLTMDTIAAETGGHAFYNTNGLAEAASRAIATNALNESHTAVYPVDARGIQASTLYSASAAPALLTKKSAQQSVNSAPHAAPEREAADPMLVALRRRLDLLRPHLSAHQHPARRQAPPDQGRVPEARLHARIPPLLLRRLGDPAPATPQEQQELSQFLPRDSAERRSASLAAAKPVMMQHYAITYGLLTRQLDLDPGPDDQRHAHLEFAAVAYDKDGYTLKGIRTRIDDTISPARYDKLQQNGYQTIQRIGVPAGTTTLRIGVRDASTRLIGSTEIHLPLALGK